MSVLEQWNQNSAEKPKRLQGKLRERMFQTSAELSASVEEIYNVRNLVDDRGAISMDGFIGIEGYTKEKVEADKKEIYEREVEWSGAREERVKEFYALHHGAKTEEDIVRIHAENKEKEKSGQMELLVPILFNKILKDDFIIVPASPYDDYMNGIDTVIVNKKTGEVAGTFDEVHNHKASDRAEKKEEKIKNKARRGGSTLTYGVTIENGSMKRKKINNLPVFFLSLTTDELDDVLKNMDYREEISKKEWEIFEKFIISLGEQTRMLSGEKIPTPVRDNLMKFEQSLSMMKNVVKNKKPAL